LPTLTACSADIALVEPFLVKYLRTGGAVPVSEPLDTVTTKPRFGLVQPVAEGYRLDIRFRILQPHELAAAMSFDKYQFTGTKKQQVKQIGNAVPVRTAEALCGAILGDVA
jgi:DNA (cytosine-5)-methyltransferase 1